MQNNVINFTIRDEIPNDLMTFKQLEDKHGLKYSYLYKWACTMGEIKTYNRGVLKLSEQDVLNFTIRRVSKYGRNKKKNV